MKFWKEAIKLYYLIAKHCDKPGCIALKTTHGEHLVRLKRRITEEVGYELIDLVTLSRPSAYVEYEPYRFVQTPEKPRPVEKPRYSIDQFQKEFEQRQRQQEDAKRKAAMAVQSALEKAAANQYRQGYGQVKEKSFQTEEIVEDKKERPNKFYLVFAIFIIVMSLIGIVSTVQFGVNTVNEIVNQTSLKNEIALFLYPIENFSYIFK